MRWMDEITFESWYEENEWHRKSTRTRLESVWVELSEYGIKPSHVAELMEEVMEAVVDEYGD